MIGNKMDPNRRSVFRKIIKNMDPAAEPGHAVASGFYVPPPSAVGKRIATRLELDPTSSHLLIGGIGTGKTTELIQVESALAEVGDTFSVRIDVPAVHRVDKLRPGVLIALTANEAVERLKKKAKQAGMKIAQKEQGAIGEIRGLVHGHWEEWDDSHPHPGDRDVWVDGIIEAPLRQHSVRVLSRAMAVVVQALGENFVVVFDGLDRLADPDLFSSVVVEDVPAIRQAGVGVVLVGPQHVRLGNRRHIVDLFTEMHLHGASSSQSPEGLLFLEQVVRRRAGGDVFGEGVVRELAIFSAGLLRDLISIAQSAAEEAYVDGSELIERSHMAVATARFGQNLLLSATTEMVVRLKDIVAGSGARHRSSRGFAVSSELDVAMLLARLVVEIPGVPTRYLPHPAVVPFVTEMAGGS
uniref:hypothetical protein n=1 Tax=Corallococcus coralloides TaxID=184914 RepID=UPI000FFF1185|nr:hypothetical protein [Corallococcus coralloides]